MASHSAANYRLFIDLLIIRICNASQTGSSVARTTLLSSVCQSQLQWASLRRLLKVRNSGFVLCVCVCVCVCACVRACVYVFVGVGVVHSITSREINAVSRFL